MIKRALVALAVTAGVVPGMPWTTGVACAGTEPSAALVVDTGGSVYSFCVSLPQSTVSGIDLIELAGDQFDLDYHFGFGGNAVCRLAGVGTSGDDCFENYPDFWGYWHGDGEGGWTWSSSGAGSTSVSDGDVEGWSWGSGDNGSTHPQPPATTFASICGEPADDPPDADGTSSDPQPPPDAHDRSDEGEKRNGGEEEGADASTPVSEPTSTVSPAPSASPSGADKDDKRVERRRDRSRGDELAEVVANASPPSSARPDDLPAAARRRAPSFPLAGGIALVIAAALALGGFDFTRRRRPVRR